MEEPETRFERGGKRCRESSQKMGVRALEHCEGLGSTGREGGALEPP